MQWPYPRSTGSVSEGGRAGVFQGDFGAQPCRWPNRIGDWQTSLHKMGNKTISVVGAFGAYQSCWLVETWKGNTSSWSLWISISLLWQGIKVVLICLWGHQVILGDLAGVWGGSHKRIHGKQHRAVGYLVRVLSEGGLGGFCFFLSLFR